MNQFQKSQALNAIHLLTTSQINCQSYAKPYDMAAATVAALEVAIDFARNGMDLSVVDSLTYRTPMRDE
jgi:hypothetical protein